MKKNIYGILIITIGVFFVFLIRRYNNVNDYINEDTTNEYEENNYEIGNKQPENIVYVTDALGSKIRLEILSCELVDDSEVATSKYYPQYFRENKYPDYPCYEEYLDTVALAEENSEFAEYYEDPNTYDINEAMTLFEENSEIVDKYRKKREVQYKYVFIDVRITFEYSNSGETEMSLSEIQCVASTEDGLHTTEKIDTICYFDKSENIEGSSRIHNFFWYDFYQNKTLECTIGFEVTDLEKYGACEYYVGKNDNFIKLTPE